MQAAIYSLINRATNALESYIGRAKSRLLLLTSALLELAVLIGMISLASIVAWGLFSPGTWNRNLQFFLVYGRSLVLGMLLVL